MLITNIRDDIAGRFRENDEWVRVANHIACDPKQIIGKLEEMFIKYNSSVNESIIRRIAVFHLSFEHIHPFVDGNGRIGRVLSNYLLIREGYVPINIKFIDRALYYDAFEQFDRNNSSSIMEEIVGKAITNSYHKRLAYLEGMHIITLNEYAKQNNLSHSNLINKAKRQTIEAFLEKGVWKIGNSTS
jgi:Fic family protein